MLCQRNLIGHRYAVEPSFWADWQDNYLLEFRGIQNKEVSVDLYFSSVDDVKAYIFDVSHDLSIDYRREVDARNESTVKAHDGDRFTAFKEISL